MVTIKEIAEQIGVSPTTVSNVLNGRVEKMSTETRKKIETALVENKYYRTDKNRSSTMPMVVVGFNAWGRENVIADPFISELLGAIELELRKYGRTVIFVVERDVKSLRKLLSEHYVEGAILVGYRKEECESLSHANPYPMVFVDSGTGDFCSVGLQDASGMRDITTYLIKSGHKKIAFFSDQPYPPVTNTAERLRGYQAALTRAGIEFEEDDYFYLPPEVYVRHETLRQFARTKAGSVYTAAVFVSDLLASDAINMFESVGVVVPDDISVTGFDDNMYAQLSRPQLTTVRQNPSAKGREAVRLLVQKIKGEKCLDSLELPTELIVRESVKVNVGNQSRYA
jgi:LacI family transcriptional regulator